MNRQRTLRLLALMASLALVLGGLACGDDDDEGGGSSKELTLNGENTVLTLDAGVVSVLQAKKVKVVPIEPAGPGGPAGVRFPITGGKVNSETLAGSIEHSGGLRFSIGRKTLEVTDFVADTEAGVLSATAGAAEIPLLTLDFAGLKKSTKGGAIVASGIGVALTPAAASAMNGILGVNFFKKGLALGELTVTATAVS
jgi:hypothetical protein